MKRISGVLLALALLSPAVARAQTTQVTTEYLMTLYAPLDPPQLIDSSLAIYNVRNGGWVKGPKVNGSLLAPGADWLRTMPSGASRLDVRATLKTDDGALIYMTYSGVISRSKEVTDRLVKGELLTSKDMYFLTAPTLQTSSEKYAWLNNVQCVGKMVELKAGTDSFVKYDIFIVR
jgi:hypothetical protein